MWIAKNFEKKKRIRNIAVVHYLENSNNINYIIAEATDYQLI